MRHLVNYSVYQQSGVKPSLHPGDGLELLTGYFEADPKDFPDTVSVHLPYVVDWYSVWSGRYRVPDDYLDDHVPFFSYGRDRDSIIGAVRKCIECAAPFDPAYGIIHAGSANIKELFSERYSYSDHEVLKSFAEIVNQAVCDPGPRQVSQQDTEGNRDHQQRFIFFVNAKIQQEAGQQDHDQGPRVLDQTGKTGFLEDLDQNFDDIHAGTASY